MMSEILWPKVGARKYKKGEVWHGWPWQAWTNVRSLWNSNKPGGSMSVSGQSREHAISRLKAFVNERLEEERKAREIDALAGPKS